MKMQELTGLRTIEQNKMLWGLLTDLSKQLKWPVNGVFVKLTPEEWKIIMSAGWKRDMRMAQAIDGGVVMLGVSTSKLLKHDMADLITLILAFGAEHEIKWTEPK